MNIHEELTTAFSSVLANSWSTELPPRPTWPALVFTVTSEPERGWVLGGGYDQHAVEVMLYARARSEISALQGQVLAVMEAMPGYMGDEAHGDAAYEADPQLYAYVMNFVVRARKESG